MKLIPFTEEHYPLLINWIPDENFNLIWGGPAYKWPITTSQIEIHQNRKDVTSFVGSVDEKPIGFIELIREKGCIVRLCRILVAYEADIGKGYGTCLIQLALDHITKNQDTNIVTLGVFERNTSAVKCYESLGFKTYARDGKSRIYKGEVWPLLRMQREL